MKLKNTIGIVGGVGPYAGMDLARKVLDNTLATSDQEHLPLSLISYPCLINDRTRFLLKGDVENPAQGIFEVIELLHATGASVVGIPCNTAHEQRIFSELRALVEKRGIEIKLLNMIDEVVAELKSDVLPGTPIGVISTIGTYATGLYEKYFAQSGCCALFPEKGLAEKVHQAIYDSGYGIKACSSPVTSKARQVVESAVRALGKQGAAAVILGCTELPMALPCPMFEGIRLIDPAAILARALIRETYPEKLKPKFG